MKKVMLMAIAIFFAATAIFAANNAVSDTIQPRKTKPAKVQYTCAMHPEVVMNKQGKCPKCGMTLVKKADAKKRPAAKKM